MATSVKALALGLVMVAAGPQAVMAQGVLDGLNASAVARIEQPQRLVAQLAERGGQPVRVIVQFAPPVIPDGIQAGSVRHDAILAGGVREVQDRILNRILAAPGGADRSQSESALSVRRMTYSPMIALNADAGLLRSLAQDPDVVSIHIDHIDRLNLTQSLPLIGMPAAYAAGATGSGTVVAVLDSGARISHEFLSSRITLGACYNTNVPGQSSSLCPGGVEAATTLASGDDCTAANVFGCGHGTHVAGTAAGFIANPSSGNPAHGVARDANIMSINVFSLFPASECGTLPSGYNSCILSWSSDQISALERVYALRNSHTFGAVNMSLGGGRYSSHCTSDSRRNIVQLLTNAGIPVVIAAGNDGFDTAVGAPACIPEAVTVGSTTFSDARSSFSNWGGLVDIAAPGSSINAPYINGNSNTFYSALSGTSMAAPHVAGALAAMRSLHPDATVAQLLLALQNTGSGIASAGTTIPRINVDRALGTFGGVATTTAVSGPATSALGAPVTFSATVTAASGTPSGTVQFQRGGVQFGSATLNASGVATTTTSALPSGPHQITATYQGGGGFQFSASAPITHTVAQPAAPPNDLFVNRIVISGPGSFAGTNVGATAEPGQPLLLGLSTRPMVWWSYTPSASGEVTVHTCGSDFDTILGVYTGSSLAALSLVQDNDDHPGCGLASQVQFQAVAGTPYQIAVAGYGLASGSISLTVALQTTSVATTTSLVGPATGTTGQTLTYTATVSASGGTPSGTVSFRRGNTQFGTGTLNAQGIATSSVSNLPVGTHQITAVYQGAAGFTSSTSAAVTTTVADAPIGSTIFIGGGSVFAPTDQCAPILSANSVPVRVRYAPAELNRLPSELLLFWPDGSETLSLWGAMTPSTSFFGAAGRRIQTQFVFYPTRPLLRVVQRQIVSPAGGTSLATAQELVLRVRVQNFGALTGCAVTIAATLSRG